MFANVVLPVLGTLLYIIRGTRISGLPTTEPSADYRTKQTSDHSISSPLHLML